MFEEKGYNFVFPEYLVRGCHMIPALERPGNFYLNDLVDGDALIRFYLQEKLFS